MPNRRLRALVLIPARYASTRFPGKPLVPLLGKPMIQRVWENVAHFFDAAIVTDDDRIEAAVKSFGGQVVRVDDDVESGTLRIGLAYERYFKSQDYDFILNVQGDEPLLLGEDLSRLVQFHQDSTFDVTTLVKKEDDKVEFHNANRVKAVFTENTGECHYFSRAAIPHDRSGSDHSWWLHVGVYCYRPKALEAACLLPASPLEQRERLEQLRVLEHGMRIGAVETKSILLGVDVPEDVAKVEERLRESIA